MRQLYFEGNNRYYTNIIHLKILNCQRRKTQESFKLNETKTQYRSGMSKQQHNHGWCPEALDTKILDIYFALSNCRIFNN